jgi:hypothetical protein
MSLSSSDGMSDGDGGARFGSFATVCSFNFAWLHVGELAGRNPVPVRFASCNGSFIYRGQPITLKKRPSRVCLFGTPTKADSRRVYCHSGSSSSKTGKKEAQDHSSER